ncbi:TetR/AcrR family transcriptional regulator [Vibrio sp.]|uniref:TetR/AcrR family transcriptional regulator n=1 Tax=Vibrio sp. TaxID=678 RepID=UPI003D108871
MTNSSRKAGRPSEETHARQRLIENARQLFTSTAYHKVSMRRVAEQAGVNSALVHYYFGSKEGLFEAMLRETLAPMLSKMRTLLDDQSQSNLADLMRTYTEEMSKVPQLPRLIAQVMQMPATDRQRQLIEKVMMDISKPMQDLLFDKLLDSGVLRPGIDANLCRVSFISLMVFPFIAPTAMFAVHGIQLTPEFLARLVEHNIQLMSEGFLTPPTQQGNRREN